MLREPHRPPRSGRRSTTPVTLARSYATCRALHRRHGTTYYWATQAFPRADRPHVHALYGLCRYADEIVDRMDGRNPIERAGALHRLRAQFLEGLAEGTSDHPVLAAVVHTAGAVGLEPSLFERFFTAMTADLSVERYASFAELMGYMDGSAAVIGEMMLPVLRPTDADAARPGARALGLAFQLTNFLRDVGEDLDRGRVYFPADELAVFGVDVWSRRVDEPWRAFARFQIARARELYAEADEGMAFLAGRSAAGVRAARRLYSAILEQIEGNDFDVFTRRARVGTVRKLTVAGSELWKTKASSWPA